MNNERPYDNLRLRDLLMLSEEELERMDKEICAKLTEDPTADLHGKQWLIQARLELIRRKR